MRMWLFAACLVASIGLNIFLASHHYLGVYEKQKLSWSQEAAAEAEAVASTYCSGHGRAYLDALVVDNNPICECNTCYGGHDCSVFSHDCAANADGGDPMYLEPFWMEHAAESALVVSGWHRMSYTFPGQSFISEQLANHIHKVHFIAKNAATEGKYIVFGAGSTQLLTAAVFALTINLSSPAIVVAQPPSYPIYKEQTDFFETARFVFGGDPMLLRNSSDSDNETVVEFVTSPNNPDGFLRKGVLEGPFVKTIHDHAYYWPHYTAIPAPADEDLMLFTISKLTGHAGTRFGWAIVKDKVIYENMIYYMKIAEMGVSRDTQLRALQLLKALLKGNGKQIFDFAYEKMRDRWEKLTKIISFSTRFTIQQIPPKFCNFFHQVKGPSPAYAWVKCEREEKLSCTEILGAAKIIGREGKLFDSDERHVRLSLLRSDDDFNLLLIRLNDLVLKENGEYNAM